MTNQTCAAAYYAAATSRVLAAVLPAASIAPRPPAGLIAVAHEERRRGRALADMWLKITPLFPLVSYVPFGRS